MEVDKPIAFPSLPNDGDGDSQEIKSSPAPSSLSGQVFARIPSSEGLDTMASPTTAATDKESSGSNMYIGYDDDHDDTAAQQQQDGSEKNLQQEESDQLPPDLTALIDSFIDGLQAPVYKAPLTGNDLSKLFQEFYIESHDRVVRYMRRYSLLHPGQDSVPLQTYDEIVKRKQERKERGKKIIVYDELIEQQVCARLYDKLFALKVSTDGSRDQLVTDKMEILKRDSKVTLKQLGVDYELQEHQEDEENNQQMDHHTTSLAAQVIESARDFHNINNVKYPKGKVDILIQVHKRLVDVLSNQGDRANLSADAILPALIYATIHNGPRNLVSNLEFVVRFRNQAHLCGEVAYCLTNFEAVARFLENVDVDTLDATKNIDIDSVLPAAAATTTPERRQSNNNNNNSQLSPGDHQSVLLKSTLSSTLESSKNFAYKLLAGRPQTQVLLPSSPTSQSSPPPRTLDDAKRMLNEGDTTTSPTRSRNASNASASIDEALASSGGRRPHHVLGRMIRNFTTTAAVAPPRPPVLMEPSSKLSPPILEFLEAKSPLDLKIRDVELLLEDYKRLASYLQSMNAFQ